MKGCCQPIITHRHAQLSSSLHIIFFKYTSNQLMVNWWFGIRIGIPVRIPIPFIFGDPIGIQTNPRSEEKGLLMMDAQLSTRQENLVGKWTGSCVFVSKCRLGKHKNHPMFNSYTHLLGGSSHLVCKWLTTMLIVLVPLPDRVVGPGTQMAELHGLSMGLILTTEASTGSPSSKYPGS